MRADPVPGNDAKAPDTELMEPTATITAQGGLYHLLFHRGD